MMAIVIGCLFGVAQGMRHALEPDHVTAVSTLVAGQSTWRRILSFAAVWGLGHALTLVVVGGALALFHARMPTTVADVFELVVAVMLVALGARGLLRARDLRRHAGGAHPVHAHTHATNAQPLGVGIVHGLAGSGALAAVAAATFPSRDAGVAFIGVYALGAALGMVLLAGAAVFPLAHFARSTRASVVLMAAAGLFSIALGVAWGWPILLHLTESAAATASAAR